MRNLVTLLIVLAAAVQVEAQQLPRTAAPDGASVYIISPSDGDTLTSPFTVRFGVRGMGVAPAGSEVGNTGHHHLLVDVAQLPPMDEPVPSDSNHLHFGGGQTEHDLTLPPGKHTLQLIFGDRLHVPFNPPLISEKVTVTVK
jgi:hypothetical protein